ncbi:MAG: alpha/beta fold hydrolase [Pseudomonadales bacterium]|nr:alpha/beta fold hydrolase [Pseudomonadales bacterium]
MSKFHYDVHDGNGPYLMLLHGILSSRAQWVRNLEGLKQHTTPVVVESFGHGRSPSPDDPDLYDPNAYVEQLEAIREEIGADSWFICGQSFGASTTLRYSLKYPKRVMGQIFTNSTSALATEELTKELYKNPAKLAENIKQRGKAGLERMSVHPSKAKRLPAGAQDELMVDAPLLNPNGLANVFQYNSPLSSVADSVSATSVPTLLVVGERESRFVQHREYAEKHIPNLEVVAADGGHAVNIDAPEAFNNAVIDFIQRQMRPPG